MESRGKGEDRGGEGGTLREGKERGKEKPQWISLPINCSGNNDS